MDERSTQPDAREVDCPHCGQAVDVTALESGTLVQCPLCHVEFTLLDESAEQAEEAQEVDREGELSGVRIQQLAVLRRGGYRTRSYYIVGIGALLEAAVGLVILTVRHVHHAGWQLRPMGYVCGAVAALMGAGFFAARALELTRELAKPLLVDPPEPPDFSALSDGSQQVKRLEEM